jgi:hypothetical protein
MKVKLTSFDRVVVPDIELTDETGKVIQNRDLDPGDRVEAEITYADPDQKLYYLGTRYETEIGGQKKSKKNTATSYSDFRIEPCIRGHVKVIRGPLSEWYHNGDSLWDGPMSAERDALIMDLFYRINGIRLDAKPFGDDGAGELTAGEN